jgi:transmembrane sensor
MGRRFPAISGWTRRLKKAAIWRLRAEENANLGNEPQFRDWLGQPSNKAAWESVGRLWDALDHHREAPELSHLRAGAWRRAHSASLFRRSRLWYYGLSAAVGAVLVIIPLAIRFFPASKSVTYATEVGQRRTLALADGSRIVLDSSSSVSVVQLTGKARTLVLNKGRAHFDVAHDPSRPFRVTVGNRMVIAVGTAFNIERLDAKILVTLTQGRVKVESEEGDESSPDKTFLLTPGQELVFAPAAAPAIAQIDSRAANAWEQGQIVLNDEPLDEAAEQLNRYLATPLLVDPAIAKMRISGVFNVGKLNSFVGAITTYFPVQSRVEKGHILLEKRA